jgi:hypothetical protein
MIGKYLKNLVSCEWEERKEELRAGRKEFGIFLYVKKIVVFLVEWFKNRSFMQSAQTL